MSRIYDQIESFTNTIVGKGYKGLFLGFSLGNQESASIDATGKLKDVLTQYAFEAIEQNKKMNQLSLETYTHWEREYKPFVRPTFYVDYSPTDGFMVKEMNIRHGGPFFSVDKKLEIDRNVNIPRAWEVNEMMLNEKTSKQSKGFRI